MALLLQFLVLLAVYAVTVVLQKLRRDYAYRQLARAHGCQHPPREGTYDILGIFKVVRTVRHLWNKTTLDSMNELFERYGETYSSKILTEEVIFTCDPRNVKHVLVTGFDDYDIPSSRTQLFRPITEHGIFAVDGSKWKHARSLYRNIFSNTRAIADLDMFEQHVRRLLRHIPSTGKPFDLQPLFLNLTLDIAMAFALGESVDPLSPTQSEEEKTFVKDLFYVKFIIARDGLLGPAHVLWSKRDFHKACDDVHRYVEAIIERALETNRHEKEQDVQKKDPSRYKLLQGLLENSSDMIELRDGVISILIAGIQSVASLLSTTFWLLARDERVYRKLRKNILDTVGQDLPTYNQLKNLMYLRYVFFEAMRLYPPVPFNAKVANKDTTLPYGGDADGSSSILVKKGQQLLYSPWAIHRSFKTFGDDAHDFRPERWAEIKGDASGYMPFSAGPRVCPGQQYALMEASYAAVRILQTFPAIVSHDSRGFTEHIELVLSNKNGVVVAFTREAAVT